MSEKAMKKVSDVLILLFLIFQLLNTAIITVEGEDVNKVLEVENIAVEKSNQNNINLVNSNLFVKTKTFGDIFNISQSEEIYLPNDNIEFAISGNTTELFNYSLSWGFFDPTGECLCNTTIDYLGIIEFNTTTYSDSFTSNFTKTNYYDLNLYNSYIMTYDENISICDINLELPVSHSLILGKYLFKFELKKDNDTIVEETIFKVEDDIVVNVEECKIERGYNLSGIIYEKEIWNPVNSPSKNYLSPGDNVALIVSLNYESTGTKVNTTIAPLETEITSWKEWKLDEIDFTYLISYNFSKDNFLGGNFSYPYNSTDYFMINFEIPNSLDYYGYYVLRMATTFDSELANHTTIKYSTEPMIIDFNVDYHVVLEEFEIYDNKIDLNTFSVWEKLDGEFRISVKHHYLDLAEFYPENNIDTELSYTDDDIVLKLYATKLSDNNTFTIDVNKIKHSEYTFTQILSPEYTNTEYNLLLEYKYIEWDDNEYNSLVGVYGSNTIEFSYDFEIVTKLVGKIENSPMDIFVGTEIILEIFFDGETEIKYDEELELTIRDADDNQLSYTYDSTDKKYHINRNRYYAEGTHWLLLEINTEDLDCVLYRNKITVGFTIIKETPSSSSTELNGDNFDLEETVKMILLLGTLFGVMALPIYMLIYNIKLKLQKRK